MRKLGKEKIEEAEQGGDHAGRFMVVNTEWGAMDNGVSARVASFPTDYQRKCLPVSIFDNKLDRESINPRKQAFEKMVSGMCTCVCHAQYR